MKRLEVINLVKVQRTALTDSQNYADNLPESDLKRHLDVVCSLADKTITDLEIEYGINNSDLV